MKAFQLVSARVVYSELAFAEMVIWKVPKSVTGSDHEFNYRLAYVVDGDCVLRYDNEVGKGDHTHFSNKESVYKFISVDRLVGDFQRAIARWNDENGNS